MDAPLLPQILANYLSPADPAADASFLAALAADATGAAVQPVDGVASATASDDTAAVDYTRPPTAPLIDAAERTVLLVVGSAAYMSSDAAVTADDAGAPPTGEAEGTVPPVAGAVVNAAFACAEAGALPAPPPTQLGKQYRRSPAVLQVASPMPRPLTMRALPPHRSTTQRGRHACRSPLQQQVLLRQIPLPSAPTAAVPPLWILPYASVAAAAASPIGRTSAPPSRLSEATLHRPSPR